MMRKLSDVAMETLKWKESSRGSHDLVGFGDSPVGRLTFRSIWGTQANGESGDGAWTFKRVGFFQTSVTVRPAGSDQEIARFKNNTWSRGGTLTFADGTTFKATGTSS